MYDRETVELALLALEEGMTQKEAAELCGASRSAVKHWAAGRLPHDRPAGRPGRRGARMVPARARKEAPVNGSERAAFEAAMTENMLLRAVLDDLKEAGSHPGSISNRRKCELGERLRAATGLPLREITAFLRISKSSYEYHRARLGRDRDAATRPLVRDAFGAVRRRGYRAVHAELARRGVRVSEKVVRRIMREEGLSASRKRRRPWSSYAGETSPVPPNLPLRPDGTHDFSAPAPQPPLGDRHHRVQAAVGREVLPEPGRRLLRRQAGRLVGRAQAHRAAGQLLPRSRLRDAWAGRGAGGAQRPGRALPMARLGRDMRGVRARAEHVAQGAQPGQRPDGGLLRNAQERVLPPDRLVGMEPGRLHGSARRVDALVPQRAQVREARLAHPGRAPRRAGLSGAVG